MKVLRTDSMGLSTSDLDMLRREAELLMTLRHPNILTMFHFRLNRDAVRTCHGRHGVESGCEASVMHQYALLCCFCKEVSEFWLMRRGW